jgi:hypothetical protein
MHEEIHLERKEKMEDWNLEEMLFPEDPTLTLRNMEKIRDLRTMLQATQEKLKEFEKDHSKNEEIIQQQRSTLKATYMEIRRLERNSLLSEFRVDLRGDGLI